MIPRVTWQSLFGIFSRHARKTGSFSAHAHGSIRMDPAWPVRGLFWDAGSIVKLGSVVSMLSFEIGELHCYVAAEKFHQ